MLEGPCAPHTCPEGCLSLPDSSCGQSPWATYASPGQQWPSAPSLPPEPSSSLPLLHRRAVGTSGFLRGCFPHFWKPTAVWFAVVKALAGAQPSGTAGGWEGPGWRRHSLSAHCVPGPRESQMLKTVPALQESYYGYKLETGEAKNRPSAQVLVTQARSLPPRPLLGPAPSPPGYQFGSPFSHPWMMPTASSRTPCLQPPSVLLRRAC